MLPFYAHGGIYILLRLLTSLRPPFQPEMQRPRRPHWLCQHR
jgi:hypothetical protein